MENVGLGYFVQPSDLLCRSGLNVQSHPGRSKVWKPFVATRSAHTGSHAQIFSAPRCLIIFPKSKNSKVGASAVRARTQAFSIAWRRPRAGLRLIAAMPCVFIFRPARGRSEVPSTRNWDRGPNPRVSPRISEIFFGRAAGTKNCREIQGGG
jgi:hypothetical protein